MVSRYEDTLNYDYPDVSVLLKLRVQNVFPSTRERRAGVFKFLRVEERL